MTDLGLPADVIGHMAGLGGTNEPFLKCASCHRALVYAALLNAGAVGVAIEAGELDAAMGYVENVIQFLVEFAVLDFRATVDTRLWADDELEIGLRAFYRSRCEHYTDEDGRVVFEPHDEDGGRWDLVPA